MVAVEKPIPAKVEVCEASHFRPFANLLRQKSKPTTRGIQGFQPVLDHLLVVRVKRSFLCDFQELKRCSCGTNTIIFVS